MNQSIFAEIEEQTYRAAIRGLKRAVAETFGAATPSATTTPETPPAPSTSARSRAKPAPAPPPRKRSRGAKGVAKETTLVRPSRPLLGLSAVAYEALGRHPNSTIAELNEHIRREDGIEPEPRAIGRIVGALRSSRYAAASGPPGPGTRYRTAAAE